MDSFSTLAKNFIIDSINDPEIKEQLQPIINAAIEALWTKIEAKKKSKELLSLNEVANVLSVTKATIHAWAKNSTLIKHKVKGSNRTYFKYSEVQEAIVQMKQYKNRLI